MLILLGCMIIAMGSASTRLVSQANQSGPGYSCSTTEQFQRKGVHGWRFGGSPCPVQGACDSPLVRDDYLIDPSSPVRTLRLHFIVLAEDDGSDPAATVEDITQQMIDVNLDFLPYKIQFTATWEQVDDSQFRQVHSLNLDVMKSALAVNPSGQCNVYVTGFSGGLGTFPWDPDAMDVQGGIVIGDQYFGAGLHVLTHELGHNLGLWHTFHGITEVGSCSACYEGVGETDGDFTGDFCADTPPDPGFFGVCGDSPAVDDTCTGLPFTGTQTENFMSYGSSDGIACWMQFTPQQAARMHCWISSSLMGWIDCTGGEDCNGNGISDACDIADGTSVDDDGDGIPDECSQGCVSDYNDDGFVDGVDMGILLSNWGVSAPASSEFDLTGDGLVNGMDIGVLLWEWGPC